MTKFQRRTFALCIFAFCFILFFEARGVRLTSWNDTPTLDGAALREIFFANTALGAIVLVLGASLLFFLGRRSVPYSWLELYLMAAGLGLLLGTALSSWLQIGSGL